MRTTTLSDAQVRDASMSGEPMTRSEYDYIARRLADLSYRAAMLLVVSLLFSLLGGVFLWSFGGATSPLPWVALGVINVLVMMRAMFASSRSAMFQSIAEVF